VCCAHIARPMHLAAIAAKPTHATTRSFGSSSSHHHFIHTCTQPFFFNQDVTVTQESLLAFLQHVTCVCGGSMYSTVCRARGPTCIIRSYQPFNHNVAYACLDQSCARAIRRAQHTCPKPSLYFFTLCLSHNFSHFHSCMRADYLASVSAQRQPHGKLPIQMLSPS
jgi:hypothetical protein